MKFVLILIGAMAVLGVVAMAVFVFVVQNVETPDYRVVERDETIEIRDYPALIVAEVRRDGDRRAALSAGFGPLAGYIFAKEREGESVSMTAPVTQTPADEPIAMTVPVTQTPTDAAGQWAVRFIMPARYDLDSLPAPAGETVRLRALEPRRVAAIRFSGRATDALIAEQESRLRAWLETRGLAVAGAPTYAYYNDPLTPGFLRRNEVMLELAATD
ncbi:SOUL family heme-binding protein [Marichromatium gracile]|uniref:SOUL heme-binding protein n=1 Tax=Marichromatium gracile TaxID=1048 RepID=A0A4R4AB82_MARGR|nr:heme-binding protein [Marichromatium gracile]MBK1709356.1 heme-binding protein [Marichromatium gracile]MBO8085838.1 heme-binding protein [Marichromatium sp.]TCW36258.1 SOUL heme-binding protein [Marichromatium gracile]